VTATRRSRLFRLVLAAACAGYSALACSLIVSTDGLSEGLTGEPAPGDEAGDGARSPEGDVIQTDGGDSGRRDAQASPFCPLYPAALFCADFDLSKKVDDGWTFESVQGATTADAKRLDPSAFLSPPVSAVLSVPSSVPGFGTGLVNRIGWNPPGGFAAGASVHVELEVRIDSIDTMEQAFVFNVSAGNGYAAALRASRKGTSLEEYTMDEAGVGGGRTTLIPRILPLGTWMHVDVDVVFVGTPSLTLKIDKALAATVALPPTYSQGISQIDIGPRYYAMTTVDATSFHFDNVLIEVKP
jgi:hypothetical protein